MRGVRRAALLLTLVVGCGFDASAPGGEPAGAAPDAAAPAPPSPLHLRVSAWIDGRSRIILSGSELQWFHLDYSAPGRLDGATLPTEIDGAEWFPTWPDEPDPENRDCGCRSLDAWDGLAAPVPRVQTATTVTPVGEMRGAARVIEQATVANDFAVVVELDDNGDAGAATYMVDIAVEPL
ncbi:MAG TPA: hypothetical protein VFU21_03755 [Kofleriaceae bacterium]|nr:hypothetical protein [Kofleriaceae bacterium]